MEIPSPCPLCSYQQDMQELGKVEASVVITIVIEIFADLHIGNILALPLAVDM